MPVLDANLLNYLGTDCGKWAAEFCKIARDQGLRFDEDLMRNWFASAIMAGRIEVAAQLGSSGRAHDAG